jgi:hypothetical protein
MGSKNAFSAKSNVAAFFYQFYQHGYSFIFNPENISRPATPYQRC